MEIRNPPTQPRQPNRIPRPPKTRPVYPPPSIQPPFPSPLFYRILTRLKSQPETALLFFDFSRSNLHFKPNISSILNLTLILIQSSKFHNESKSIIEPFLRSEPVDIVLNSAIRAASQCKGSKSRLLSFVLENYSVLRLIPSSLETLKRIRVLGLVPETASCNELLDALCWGNCIDHALVCYGVLMRVGFECDERSWDLICRVFCGRGKIKRAEKLLDLGVCGFLSYDLVIDCYCKRGEFSDALWVFDQMRKKNLNFAPSFVTYASFLDGGCKLGSSVVVNLMLKEMIVGGLMPTVPFLDYDWVISRFCELEKNFAAEMFFERARNTNVKLEKGVYASFFTTLAKKRRLKEAMGVYKIMLQGGVENEIAHDSYDVFFSGICKEEPSEEVESMFKILIGKGFVPITDDLSLYIAAQCNKGKWNEASDLLNLVLEKGVQLDAFCCSSLVTHYCTNGFVDSAIMVHEKLKKSGGCLDIASYNALLEALFLEKRIEEAIQVFEYIKEKRVLSSDSYVTMIGSLCRVKEMRKAMNLHDEMVRMKLKPDDASYRKLISGFV